MAAPMAPPPRAKPPPTRAPALRIESATLPVSVAIIYSSWDYSMQCLGLRSVLLIVVMTHGEAKVEHGEQHKDEGLDSSEKSGVKELPHDLERRSDVDGKQRQHHDHHQAAGEDVAEKSKGHGDRLGDLFNDVDGRQREKRLGVVLEVSLEAARLKGLHVHPDNDEGHHGERQIHVAGGRREDSAGDSRAKRRRQEVQPVADENKEKEGHAEWNESVPLGPNRGVGQLTDLFDEDLPNQLEFARHAIGGFGAHAESEEEKDGRGQQRGQHDVVVDRQ